MSTDPSQPKIIDPPAWLDRTIFPFRNHIISILSHDIHYIDEGSHDKPTLLLLHGNGSWSFGFRLAIPRLSQHFRVIAPDYPGLGLSKAGPNYSFKPQDHSHVIEAFVDALHLSAIRLFVEDWGGPIGLGFAGRRPELIHSLFISNTWAWPAQGSRHLEGFSMLVGSAVGRFLITRFNLFARYFIPNLTIAKTLTPAELMGYYMPYPTVESRIPQSILPHEILASEEYLKEVEAGLARLAGKPVLIIWGERDGAFGEIERNRLVKNHFGRAEVLLLPNAKHFSLLDEPERSVDAIVAFENGDSRVEVMSSSQGIDLSQTRVGG